MACPPMLARLAVTETRVRVMSNHWNQVPLVARWLEPDAAVLLRHPYGGAHLVDRASLAAAHRGRCHLAHVAPEVSLANGGVGGGDLGPTRGLRACQIGQEAGRRERRARR